MDRSRKRCPIGGVPGAGRVVEHVVQDDYGALREAALRRTLSSGWLVPLVAAGVSVITLPLVSRVLTTAEYGVFAAIVGFTALIGFADLGTSANLTNQLASVEPNEQGLITARALCVAASAAIIVGTIGTLAAALVPWQTVLGTTSVPQRELRLCVLVLALATAAGVIGSLGQGALFGLQRGASANVWLLTASVLTGLGLLATAVARGPLWAFVLVTAGAPAMTSLGCTFWLLATEGSALRPEWRRISARDVVTFARGSGWFFAIAVASAISYQTDLLVVAGVLGAAATGVYSVATRVFGLILQAQYPFLNQLWPAFRDALARGDKAWARKRFTQYLTITAVVSGAFCVGLALACPPIIGFWLTRELEPSSGLAWAMGAWTLVSVTSGLVLFVLNGLSDVRMHAKMAIGVACLNLPLSIAFTHVLGEAGPALGSAVATFCCAGVPGFWLVRRRLAADDGVVP